MGALVRDCTGRSLPKKVLYRRSGELSTTLIQPRARGLHLGVKIYWSATCMSAILRSGSESLEREETWDYVGDFYVSTSQE